MEIRKRIARVVLAVLVGASLAACSKGNGSSSAQASPAATMVYSGSTDTSTGGAVATPAVADNTGGKMISGDPVHGKQIFYAELRTMPRRQRNRRRCRPQSQG